MGKKTPGLRGMEKMMDQLVFGECVNVGVTDDGPGEFVKLDGSVEDHFDLRQPYVENYQYSIHPLAQAIQLKSTAPPVGSKSVGQAGDLEAGPCVTPAMANAGSATIEDMREIHDSYSIAIDVYKAMYLARPTSATD